ncbi:MAG: hypothetical protein ABDH21_04460 [bacterium]
MEIERTWFLVECYLMCFITTVFLFAGIYSLLLRLIEGLPYLSYKIPFESLLKPIFFKYKLIFKLIYFAISLFLTYTITPTLFKFIEHKAENRYSYYLWRKTFKNVHIVGEIEIQRYEPFGANLFKYILKNQKFTKKELIIYERNTLMIYYHKQTKKYAVALAEIKLVEYEKVIRGGVTNQYLLFNGFALLIPNEILNYQIPNNYSVFLEIRSSNYTVLMINHPDSLFKFELHQKVDNQKIQNRLEKILQVVKNFLL